LYASQEGANFQHVADFQEATYLERLVAIWGQSTAVCGSNYPYADLCHNGKTAQTLIMEPISTLLSLSITKLMSAVNWSDLVETGLKAGASAGGKDLWSHLKPGERKKLAQFIGNFFVEAFYKELRLKIDLTATLPAYEDALKYFLKSNIVDLVV
jgi:hypothetical protein